MNNRRNGALGIYGRSNVDYLFHDAKVTHPGPPLRFVYDGITHSLLTDRVAHPGDKLIIDALPTLLLEQATETVFGGGLINSLIACRKLFPDLSLRSLDACRPHPDLKSILPAVGVKSRYLNLREVARYLLLGFDTDKLTIKTPNREIRDLGYAHYEMIEWLLTCPSVLVNSAAEPQVLDHLISHAGETGTKLYFVVTPNLTTSFILERVLPAAGCVIINQEDAAEVFKTQAVSSSDGAYATIERIREYAKAADIVVTLGAGGLAAQSAESGSTYRVCLERQTAADVQALVQLAPEKASGVGDWFAAGLCASVATETSLLSIIPNDWPSLLRSCLTGCVAAVRKFGYDSPLSAAQFEIREVDPGVRQIEPAVRRKNQLRLPVAVGNRLQSSQRRITKEQWCHNRAEATRSYRHKRTVLESQRLGRFS